MYEGQRLRFVTLLVKSKPGVCPDETISSDLLRCLRRCHLMPFALLLFALCFLSMTLLCAGALRASASGLLIRACSGKSTPSLPTAPGTSAPVDTPGCWSVSSSPNSGSYGNVLTSIAVVSADDIWAGGDFQSTSGFGQTLVSAWGGSGWGWLARPGGGETDELSGM